MNHRDQNLVAVRPHISKAIVSSSMSLEEQFQNQTLRPIIKLQHPLLISVFKNYIHKHKNVFQQLSPHKQLDYIDNALQRDQKFRNIIKGIIIGQFTVNEYTAYSDHSSKLNKRMLNIVKERLIDSLQLYITDNL